MKYILVTGANGGMGRATADLFVKRGFRVFALDKTPCSAPTGVIPLQTDITDTESVDAAFSQVCKETDELYGIIHLAGMYMLDSLVEMAPSDFEKIFRVNLGGVFLINRAFRPLLKNGSSVIIVTSELAPRDPLPFTGIYGITKTALDKYAYSLRMELQLSGINVSVLRAGAVDTGMLDESTKQLDSFCKKTVRYKVNAGRFRRIVDSFEARKIPSAKIAEKLFRIFSAKKPKFAYSLNRNALLILFDALPSRMRFYIIRKILGSSDKNQKQRSIPNNKC